VYRGFYTEEQETAGAVVAIRVEPLLREAQPSHLAAQLLQVRRWQSAETFCGFLGNHRTVEEYQTVDRVEHKHSS
jgi:hypothetical protein